AEKVLKAGLRWPDAELAWEAMTEASIAAEQSLRQRVAYLSTVASIATMIGLFGTVYGLIMSFAALGDVAATERAARLSEGSSTAMASTAFGLLVAIPALAAHAFAEATVRERLSAIEGLASRLILLLKARRRA
ncbi:MAG TPA: MotA/TolQ/ExbB proton channel family protein, partial [Myxococcota bacterium]|nr:MotA/TolQ/ExbB proton channel family protein [Myxococcota bacterium]